MTIRRILLLAFLLVGLLPATALTVLSFQSTRAAMLAEIELGVRRSATAVAADVEKVLYERALNASTWNHLEVMQDLRLGDVDKRLSAFLAEMKQRYGDVYRGLHAVDADNRIVASSEAARIGTAYAPATPWIRLPMAGGETRLERPAKQADGVVSLVIRIAIASQFTEGDLGDLVLEVDWRRVQAILDGASDRTRKLVVLDAARQPITISHTETPLDIRALPVQAWLDAPEADALPVRDGRPLIDAPVIVGSERSRGYGTLPALDWTYLVLQSRDVALAPVQRMAWTFAGLLALMALIIVGISLLVAGVIARPVTALTDFTRRYGLTTQAPAPAPGPGEIGELTRSFLRLVEDLARSQQTLAQASKLAAIGEITAMLAHDVRTPLGILRSSAQTLASEPDLSPEARELLGIINSETTRLNNLISSLLDSARTRTPQREHTDVHALIRHSATLLTTQARERRIELRLSLAASEPSAECDAEQVTQVLLNLGMNALQILPPGGIVEIVTTDGPNRLQVEVCDNGPGIAPGERTRLFEPFVYRREGGIGLGLAVVRQIVRQHGGDIVIDDAPLGGACFRFWLPRRSFDIR